MVENPYASPKSEDLEQPSKNPSIARWAFLFAVAYIGPLAFLAYSLHFLGLKPPSSMNLFLLIIAVIFTNIKFAQKFGRSLTHSEYIRLLVCCTLVDWILQISVAALLVNHSLYAAKLVFVVFILISHAVLLAIGLLPGVVRKYVRSAA